MSATTHSPLKKKFWSRLCIRQPLAPIHKCLQPFLDLKKLTLSTDGTIFMALESHSAYFKPSDTHVGEFQVFRMFLQLLSRAVNESWCSLKPLYDNEEHNLLLLQKQWSNYIFVFSNPRQSCNELTETSNSSFTQQSILVWQHQTSKLNVSVLTWVLPEMNDGFSGLVVSMLASGTQVCGFKPGRSRWIFSDVKSPQHAFLWRGSKRICPMCQLCGMLKNLVNYVNYVLLAKFQV